MAISTYSDLQAAVSRWAGGSDDDNFAQAIRDSIALTEADMDDRLRVPEMIQKQKTVATAEFESLPVGVLKVLHVGLLSASGIETPLKPVSPIHFDGTGTDEMGTPSRYAILGGQIRFRPIPSPSASVQFRITFYGAVPRLDDNDPCTLILQRYPSVYLFGSLMHLSNFTHQRDQFLAWGQRFDSAIAQANMAGVTREASVAR